MLAEVVKAIEAAAGGGEGLPRDAGRRVRGGERR